MQHTPYRYSDKIREEELKNKIAEDFFAGYDTTQIIGNIDFCVALHQKQQHSLFEHTFLLWAEAKKGYKYDLYEALVQLVLTIGKSKTYERFLPPPLLGAFNAAQIVFIPYNAVMEVFSLNDFNWNVTPSNHDTKEFQQLYALIQNTIATNLTVFDFNDHNTLKLFIHNNFKIDQQNLHKIQITKNNFISVYFEWRVKVQPTIAIDWELAKQSGILDADFYLADLLSNNNITLKEKLFVILQTNKYIFDRKQLNYGITSISQAEFKDGQKGHTQFWNKYERPPREEFWDFIIDRRDQLVPQDIRERKGSFYTPRQWVELSQQYIADVLGENWQEEYYIWDCAAGTGNLLVGLHNKYNIWASTLDQADVDIMKERITHGANLLESHVFQFDFLNDDFTKLPEGLRKIVNDPEERKKLVIYINPPYAEVSSKKIGIDKKKGKKYVNMSRIHDQYITQLGTAGRELYTQFLIRIYYELKNCFIANFSKLKTIIGSAFVTFRRHFNADLKSLFLMPSNTFDNVSGKFPIGFFIWNTNINNIFTDIIADVYNEQFIKINTKKLSVLKKNEYINKWISKYKEEYDHNNTIGWMDGINGNDFQHNDIVFIVNSKQSIANPRGIWISKNNLIQICIYYAIRRCFIKNWMNTDDQYYVPNNNWKKDHEFQNNCLTFTIFNTNITSSKGTNYWIPFTEHEVNAQDKFESHFMTDFISGKLSQQKDESNLMIDKNYQQFIPSQPLIFSPEAQTVFNAGRELYTYYHAKKNINVNASLYEIKEYFQGRNDKGKLKTTSADAKYNELYNVLKQALKILAEKIAPKVYEYGFLK